MFHFNSEFRTERPITIDFCGEAHAVVETEACDYVFQLNGKHVVLTIHTSKLFLNYVSVVFHVKFSLYADCRSKQKVRRVSHSFNTFDDSNSIRSFLFSILCDEKLAFPLKLFQSPLKIQLKYSNFFFFSIVKNRI